MVTKLSDRFAVRRGPALIVSGAVAAVLLAVLAYRLTAPRSMQTTATSGAPLPENALLRVGALPVT